MSQLSRFASHMHTLGEHCKDKWHIDGSAKGFWRAVWLPLLCATLAAAIMLLGLVLAVSGMMQHTTTPYILTQEQALAQHKAEEFDCILVLGAGLTADGTPSPMLYDRVKVGSDLHHLLEDTVILMSGDHTGDYNEVAAMKRQAMDFDVPESYIFLDEKGYSTYESMENVKTLCAGNRVLIVTQSYHLYRAIHIARTLGIDAYGVASDLRPYRGQVKYDLREILARYKDFFCAASKND